MSYKFIVKDSYTNNFDVKRFRIPLKGLVAASNGKSGLVRTKDVSSNTRLVNLSDILLLYSQLSELELGLVRTDDLHKRNFVQTLRQRSQDNWSSARIIDNLYPNEDRAQTFDSRIVKYTCHAQVLELNGSVFDSNNYGTIADVICLLCTLADNPARYSIFKPIEKIGEKGVIEVHACAWARILAIERVCYMLTEDGERINVDNCKGLAALIYRFLSNTETPIHVQQLLQSIMQWCAPESKERSPPRIANGEEPSRQEKRAQQASAKEDESLIQKAMQANDKSLALSKAAAASASPPKQKLVESVASRMKKDEVLSNIDSLLNEPASTAEPKERRLKKKIKKKLVIRDIQGYDMVCVYDLLDYMFPGLTSPEKGDWSAKVTKTVCFKNGEGLLFRDDTFDNDKLEPYAKEHMALYLRFDIDGVGQRKFCMDSVAVGRVLRSWEFLNADENFKFRIEKTRFKSLCREVLERLQEKRVLNYSVPHPLLDKELILTKQLKKIETENDSGSSKSTRKAPAAGTAVDENGVRRSTRERKPVAKKRKLIDLNEDESADEYQPDASVSSESMSEDEEEEEAAPVTKKQRKQEPSAAKKGFLADLAEKLRKEKARNAPAPEPKKSSFTSLFEEAEKRASNLAAALEREKTAESYSSVVQQMQGMMTRIERAEEQLKKCKEMAEAYFTIAKVAESMPMSRAGVEQMGRTFLATWSEAKLLQDE